MATISKVIFRLVLILFLLVLFAKNTNAQSSPPYDSGLSGVFVFPDSVTGRTLNVLNYGATPNNSSNDDAQAFRNAISAAVTGDEIFIPSGTYHLKTGDILLKSGVSVRGQARDTTFLTTILTTNPYAAFYALQGINNLTLSNFTITKTSGNNLLAGIRLGQGNPLGDNSTYQQVSRIRISNLDIENFTKFGVQMENAYHVMVENSIFRNAAALDGGGEGYGVMLAFDRGNNNWIRNNRVGPVIRHGILLQYRTHHNLVEGNTVEGAVADAIDLHGEDEYSNELKNNTVHDCPLNGTSVSPNGAGFGVGEYSGAPGLTTEHDNSGPYNWIHHNEVYNCMYGLRIVNNSNYTYIEDNNFHNNITSGIQADLYALNHLYIRRNKITYNPYGIRLYDVSYATIEGNTITNNSLYGIWTNSGTIYYYIAGNYITNNGANVNLGSTNGTYIISSTTTPTPGPTSSVTPIPTSSPTPIPKPGDANGDGRVDETDYQIWLSHYNTNSAGATNGDFNNNGRVDGLDFVIWLNYYGT